MIAATSLAPDVAQRGVPVDVRQVEKDVLVDAQHRQAPLQLAGAYCRQSSRGGHRSGSSEPPSPRVAVTQTTREPAAAACAISPDDR